MNTIHKFTVVSATFGVWLPKGAKVLTVQTQRDQPQMWVMLDPENETEYRTFLTFPTGGEMPTDTPLDYIGTFQLADGALVFHLFEVGR